MLIVFAYVVAFLALSGLMAAIDAAVLSVTHPEIDEMIQLGSWGARRLQRVRRHIRRSVVVIVIVTNTINVLGPILCSHAAFQEFGPEVLGIMTLVLTFGTIVFSEIIPKALGTHYSPLISRVAAPSIQMLDYALYPLVSGLAWLSKHFTKGTRPIGTEEQIRSLVTIGRRAGFIESDESHLIQRAFVLNDRTAGDVMTRLPDVVGLRDDQTIAEAAEVVHRNAYSRYPVFGRSRDAIRGLVLSRDILGALVEGRSTDPLHTIVRPALVIDAARRSDELLVIFRDCHVHLAIVHRNRKTIGIVTLEDVLEELIGEIEDEKDIEGH